MYLRKKINKNGFLKVMTTEKNKQNQSCQIEQTYILYMYTCSKSYKI